jgi:4-amino-4-deoxy-L-arabinose transferase-like glycosyltransferase
VSPRYAKILIFAVISIAIYITYFFHLTAVGLIGPDEPRYAAIGREMAQSGEWITPRLWGEAWFEKPALLYWMIGIGFRLGLSSDLAPRLPIAILSVTFLIFYYWILRGEFGARAAAFSSMLLGTSAGWIVYSQAGVTDLPLAACFSTAILLTLPWISKQETALLPIAAALLGLAVLAKGLVPLVLLLPLFWFGRRRLFDLINPRVLFVFVAVVLPWYYACYARNGMPFIQKFFIEHQFGRFTSAALQHGQPAWFYLPALLGLIFPWFFFLGLLVKRGVWSDPRKQFLLAVFLFGFLFFSASTNKLPGYLLPLLPALFALIGIRLDQTKWAGELLFPCIMLLVFVPAAAIMLPVAVSQGMSRAWPVETKAVATSSMLIPILIMFGFGMLYLARTGRAIIAVSIGALTVVVALYFVKSMTLPAMDASVSARDRKDTCIASGTTRAIRYGLNYYSGTVLPDCR